MFKNFLGDIDEYLEKLVAEACFHAAGTAKRQKKLDEIIRTVMGSDHLWWENTPYYEDALQQTWLYLCKNPERYDPDHAKVITWLNTYLKWRLLDFSQGNWKTEISRRGAVRLGSTEETQKFLRVDNEEIENLPASHDIPSILEETRKWVEIDPSGELRKTHVTGRPDVNCQSLILLRLPPEVRWKTIANNFHLSNSTASSFYSRKAMPLLRNFGVEQGYLD